MASIAAERLHRVLVLGAAGIGKSTFCRLLAGELTAAGPRVAVVDTDIGQKDVGPPATITLGYCDAVTDFTAMAPEAFYFVGSTSPAGRLLPMVVGAQRLVAAADAPFVIIDTTGFIHGTGRVLKGYKIEAVRPDLIVAIARKAELDGILRPYRTFPTVRLRPSRRAWSKDSWQRYLARKRAFAAYFAGARRVEIALAEVAIQRSPLFSGEPIQLDGATYAERSEEGIVAVASGPLTGPGIVQTLPPQFAKNLLCGVADADNEGLGLAIVQGIDFARKAVSLTTPVAAERIRALQLGDLYLDAEGNELGRAGPERRYSAVRE